MEGQARHIGAERLVAALIAGATHSPTLSRSSSLASSLGSDEPVCRYCWAPEMPGDPLVTPCSCRGTCSQVHYRCLVRWVSVSSSFYWATDNSLGSLRPASCELCSCPFFEASPARRDMVLTTAQYEWNVGQLYATAGQLAEDEAEGGVQEEHLLAAGAQLAEAGAGAEAQAAAAGAEAEPAQVRWGQAVLALSSRVQRSYWRLALRPVQAAILFDDIRHYVNHPAGKGGELTWLMTQMVRLGAGWGSSWLLRFLRRKLEELDSDLAALALRMLSLSWVMRQGESIGHWLAQGSLKDEGTTAFGLALPITTPYFEWWATMLAVLGALRPGRNSAADGLRAVAGLPLWVVTWVLSAKGRESTWRALGTANTWLRRLFLLNFKGVIKVAAV